MKLIVGLGNPGEKYKNTRHNVGFDVIDKLVQHFSINDKKEKFQGILWETVIKGEKIFFLEPQTYMNLSGNSLISIINFYKIEPQTDLLVIYDDMDLPIGKVRIRKKGSAGGHNGMKSIISHVGIEFCRVRCGIGKPKNDSIDFVLGKFSKEESELAEEMLEIAKKAVIDFIDNLGIDEVMQRYN
ncbi:aminoacyl-tRNA hydrolase [Fusobacterium sp. PH5-44]|uniref:aminoacyl-tRNA hydrolase n=1 Tax=unclassified Fusobacterium TaxID=2648384 RepID=UPI003D201A01